MFNHIFLLNRYEVRSMQVFRSALSACVIKDLPDIEYYLPLDRDRLSEEGRKNIERNIRENNINSATTTLVVQQSEINDESVVSVVTQQDHNPLINGINFDDDDDDDDNIIFVFDVNNRRE